MPQPAVIVEWWGHYDTLDDVREANEGFRQIEQHAFCMALGGGISGGDTPRYRYIISWQRAWPGAVSFPVDHRLSDAGNQRFYLGWVASFNPGATRQTAEWALIRALHPELNDPPAPCPPGEYCGSVCSWFYTVDEGEKRAPPAGFPTVVTFNSYDEERVLRLRLDGCA